MTTNGTLIPSTDSLARAINAEYRLAEKSSHSAVEHALACGSLLLQAKGEVPHGEWRQWIGANVQFSLRTAQAYMNLAENFPALDGPKAQRVALLSIREACALLAEQPLDIEPDAVDGKPPEKAARKSKAITSKSASDNDKQANPREDPITDDDGATGIPAREPRDKTLDDRSEENLPKIEQLNNCFVDVITKGGFLSQIPKPIPGDAARGFLKKFIRELREATDVNDHDAIFSVLVTEASLMRTAKEARSYGL